MRGGIRCPCTAESSGFGSASAFSRTCKKEFGISPKQYREKLSQPTRN
ncbi:MAG: helix-turn-helix domain-containing protein [Chthoniobacteraceae bacterium]